MKKDWVEMERKLTALAMEENGYDDEQLDALHEKARQRLMASVKETKGQPAKQKSLGRKMLIAACAALALMVLSVVYTIAFPVEVGKANNFAKRMTVWVNGVLGREYEVEVPFEDEEIVAEGNQLVADDIVKIADSIDYPLLVLNEEASDYALQSANASESSSGMMAVYLEYTNDNSVIKIINQIGLHDQSVVYFNDAELINTNCGDMYVWQSENGMRGAVLSEYGIVQIKTDLEVAAFYDLVSSFQLTD